MKAAIESTDSSILPTIPRSAYLLSTRTVRYHGAARGLSLDVLIVVCRRDEFPDLLQVIDSMQPCFATTRTPEIRWLIER
ncbi:hypothetical protein CH299_04510 [Rhodococcus sp. 14-2686-1-2]|nr:hypothetical protein CH301_03965 [Rhodococcus sp. 15-1189-1-1a]OZF20336.1 hypothetical protein CH299_04510 [Rhodococcus sp. 14-2686-1-2]